MKADGTIDLEDLKRAIDDKTILVTIMAANNEIGVLQPIREIGKLCHERGVLFHTDAVQAVGKVPFNVIDDYVDVASISAHKIYGPKGVGALYVRRRNPRVQIAAEIDGGGHERGMRSGTLNVPGIVGLGKACELAQEELLQEGRRLQSLRDRLKTKLEAELDYVHVNGSMEHRLPGNLNMSFVYVEGESLLMGINDVAVSSGSACTSATLGAFVCAEGFGIGRRCSSFEHSLWSGPLQYRGRSGLRGRQGDPGGAPSARAVAALRDGEGRHRYHQGGVAGALRKAASAV